MARGDFPFDRHGLNLRPIVGRPRVRAEVGVPLNNRSPGGPTCRSKTIGCFIPRLCRKSAARRCCRARGRRRHRAWSAACVCARVGVSVMAVAASLRSGAWRSPLVGSNGEVSGIFLPRQPAVRHARRSRRWRTADDEDDSGRGAVRRPGHQKSSRGVRQRPALARVPEGFRSSKGPRRENAGGDHARRVAHPAAPRHCATVPGSGSTGLSQAAALQRWRARLTGHCVPTSQSAPRSPRTYGTSS